MGYGTLWRRPINIVRDQAGIGCLLSTDLVTIHHDYIKKLSVRSAATAVIPPVVGLQLITRQAGVY